MIATRPVRRLFAAGSPRSADHLRAFGARRSLSLGPLVEELRRAGLEGRGGAGFPAHRKLAAVAEHSDGRGRAIVVGNGSEGEPWSVKDAALLTAAPHLVLDGLLACADALDTRDVHLVIHASTEPAVRAAIAERDDADAIRVHLADDGFVSGEASAVFAGVEGRRWIPTDRTVRLAQRGVRRRPTLVQNVETLAHIALISRFGADWHRAAGTTEDPGTRLVSLGWGEHAPQVLEIPGGSPLRPLLHSLGAPEPQAALIGGFHGTWVPPAALDAPFSREGLAPWAASPGAGVVHVLSPGSCGLQLTARIATELAAASAGQCGPCIHGLPRLAEEVRLMLAGQDTRGELERIAGLVDGRGACTHPNATVRMLGSGLRLFGDEVAAHAQGGCAAKQAVRT